MNNSNFWWNDGIFIKFDENLTGCTQNVCEFLIKARLHCLECLVLYLKVANKHSRWSYCDQKCWHTDILHVKSLLDHCIFMLIRCKQDNDSPICIFSNGRFCQVQVLCSMKWIQNNFAVVGNVIVFPFICKCMGWFTLGNGNEAFVDIDVMGVAGGIMIVFIAERLSVGKSGKTWWIWNWHFIKNYKRFNSTGSKISLRWIKIHTRMATPKNKNCFFTVELKCFSALITTDLILEFSTWNENNHNLNCGTCSIVCAQFPIS